jgi:RNA polymerase sigma factor (sigma-70 family)
VFPTTRWTLIRQAATAPTDESRTAMEELCRRYRTPVLRFVRRRVNNAEQAEDLTQEFFTRLVRGDLLQRAEQDRGQFRAFLLHVLGQFLLDERDRAMALKRGAGMTPQSLSQDSAIDPAGFGDAEQEFDLAWARTLLQRAVDRLQQEYSDQRSALFDSLKDSLDGARPMARAELAARLGMSEGAIRVALHRMRTRLGQLIREEVADTVPSGSDIDDEIRLLRKTLEQRR